MEGIGTRSIVGVNNAHEARILSNKFGLKTADSEFLDKLGSGYNEARKNMEQAIASQDEAAFLKAQAEFQAKQRALTLWSELSKSMHEMMMRLIGNLRS